MNVEHAYVNRGRLMKRRTLLTGGAAAIATISTPALAFDKAARLNWETAKFEQFEALVDKPFTVMTEDGHIYRLRLISVEEGLSGAKRPKNLPRSESLSLTFKGKSIERLIRQGHQTAWISNPVLGQYSLFLGAVPLRSGEYVIEAVLN